LEIDKKSMKKMFPNLSRELEGGESKVAIDSVRADAAKAEETLGDAEETLPDPDIFLHYNPDVVDFLRRCDTEAQAEEIITYMEKRGEISKKEACELRKQLKKEGVRSFGSKKEDDYYFKQSGLC
jgi:hypothetical protein